MKVMGTERVFGFPVFCFCFFCVVILSLFLFGLVSPSPPSWLCMGVFGQDLVCTWTSAVPWSFRPGQHTGPGVHSSSRH